MSTVFRANRKASDDDIIRANSVGLSLSTIAGLLNCHPTTITLRLKSLGVAPADTRRTFMEDVLMKLPPAQLEWIETQLGPHLSIKAYVRSLITDAYLRHKNDTQIQKATP